MTITVLENRERQLRDVNFEQIEKLVTEKKKYTLLMETLIDPVILVDSRHMIQDCNYAARQLTKDTALPGRSLMEATRSYELDNLVDEILNDVNDLPREVTIQEHLFRVRLSALTDGDTKTGVLMILRDVSELQRLGRARRDFVANISHELRTPLTAIRLLVDTMRMTSNDDFASRIRLYDQVSSQVDALTQLAQEMYDLSLIESGQVPMRMVRASMHDLTDQAIVRLGPQAERSGIVLDNKIGADVIALVDVDQIRRVLTNLLHNAIKFTPGGVIVVQSVTNPLPPVQPSDVQGKQYVQSPDDLLAISIQDNGSGIATTDLPRIFERFYKVNRARGKSGTGLGLAIAKHIVEAHGGRIWVESMEGRGATFFFTVPREG